MRVDTVGEPIFFLAPSNDEEANTKDLFQAYASATLGPEAGRLLTSRIAKLMEAGVEEDKPVVIAAVREDNVEVAILHPIWGQEIFSFPIPEGLDARGAGEWMIDVISQCTLLSQGITDMLVNQILCDSCPDNLSALRKG